MSVSPMHHTTLTVRRACNSTIYTTSFTRQRRLVYRYVITRFLIVIVSSASVQQRAVLDGEVLFGDLHESVQCELVFWVFLVIDDGVEVDEVEVVELTRRQTLVERLHHAPRPVSHAHHDD